MTLLRGDLAPPARTLVDVFEETVEAYPDEPALDNGAQVLTYTEFAEAASEVAAELHELGIGRGDRVGVRISSGTLDLYVAIMGTLTAGAAYVPVDADDPEQRARLVFGEASVAAVIGDDLAIVPRAPADAASTRPLTKPGPVDPAGTETTARAPAEAAPTTSPPTDPAPPPSPVDDAWVIFTSGSTGTPKGVAVSHRSAAAFVDAEARLFLQGSPLGQGDRVMAGLSVAFDASCEEMWLAWRHGGCLVPVPRSLVRSGLDLGPWLVANDITVVSTVPTLVALWPPESIAEVRLLILGGEACPPELAERLSTPAREVWNTYGPTEATVVACGSLVDGTSPVRIGLPLDGWDLAVVDKSGEHVNHGETGELIIGGVGLGHYLDPAKDAEKYAAMPHLGWDRAYRSGDLVVYDEAGLVFVGRADDQIKLGGRRIELGEIDSAIGRLAGVVGAAAAIRRTSAGNQVLIGYVVRRRHLRPACRHGAAAGGHARRPGAAAGARGDLPTRTSGKIDRDALPWPLTDQEPAAEEASFEGTAAWVAELWREILGAVVTSADDDFFDLGGGSLTSAQLVSRLRSRFPEITVADIYQHPTVGGLAKTLDELAEPAIRSDRKVGPTPRKTQGGQAVFGIPLRTIAGLRWLTWLAAGNNVAVALFGLPWLPTLSWWWVAVGWLLLLTPPGRMGLTAVGARALLRGVEPGDYPRGGRCICGSGWPSGWPMSSARRTSRGPPG